MIDNRGGAAVEVRGWDDRARLELTLSQWSPEQPSTTPSVRLGGSLQWRWMFLQAGVQDLLARDRIAAYLGVGMRWHDPDLKAALPWISRL